MTIDIPGYVQRFRDALLEVQISKLSISCCEPEISGERGILTTSKIQYNKRLFNLLGRDHEYTFHVDQRRIQVSIQLYLNTANHWRLFAYADHGMLLSVNLTTERKAKNMVALGQVLRIMNRASMNEEERANARTELVHCLRGLGFEVDHRNKITFGTFDGRRGGFLDTTAAAFVRDFTVAAVVKGHFMQNKGYRLPGLHYEKTTLAADAVPSKTRQGRSVPYGLRFHVLERDGSRCLACGATPKDGAKLHVDHVVPWTQGGRTELGNLQTLCSRCNLGKGNRSTHDFR